MESKPKMEGARRVTVTFILDEPINKRWDEPDVQTWLKQNIIKEAWEEDIIEIESIEIESDITDQDIS